MQTVRDAVEGKPDKSLVYVRAGDVLELCSAIAEPDKIVQAVRKGSAGAGDPNAMVWVQSVDLRHCLEQAE